MFNPSSFDFEAEFGKGRPRPACAEPRGRARDLTLIAECRSGQVQDLVAEAEQRGFPCAIASSGAEALSKANELNPSIIVLAQRLPDADGYSVCRSLREDRAARGSIVVLLAWAEDRESASASPPTSESKLAAVESRGSESQSVSAECRGKRPGLRVQADFVLAAPFDPQEFGRVLAAAQAHRERLRGEGIASEIGFEMDNNVPALMELNDFLTSLHAETPLSSRQAVQLSQAIVEIGMNAIEWGNRCRRDAFVRVRHRLYADRIELAIRDEGEGFDPADLPHAASPGDPLSHMEIRESLGLRDGGFGLQIARGMVDEFRIGAFGNEVVLAKRFAAG